jgi:hypothetical protein
MTTFATEDRELVEKEQISFCGHCYLTDTSSKDKNALMYQVLYKFEVGYRIDDSSEDLDD